MIKRFLLVTGFLALFLLCGWSKVGPSDKLTVQQSDSLHDANFREWKRLMKEDSLFCFGVRDSLGAEVSKFKEDVKLSKSELNTWTKYMNYKYLTTISYDEAAYDTVMVDLTLLRNMEDKIREGEARMQERRKNAGNMKFKTTYRVKER